MKNVKIIIWIITTLLVLLLSNACGNNNGKEYINMLKKDSYKADGQLFEEGDVQYSSALWSVPKTETATDFFRNDGIEAVFYESVEYDGKTTKVFAYIGFPKDASEQNKVPGVVCVHGGGGTAYVDWIKQWNEKGYAAIAMDTEGGVPTSDGKTSKHHENGGKQRTSYSDENEPIENQWMYQATAAAIGANSLLRSYNSVDVDRIGITGISWGGVIAAIVTGYDDRFAFSIPVYGCLSLENSYGYFGTNIYSVRKKAAQLWDTVEPLSKVSTPILWLNGNLDLHFSVDATTRSYEASQKGFIFIKNYFTHGHYVGWQVEEIYAFADSVCKDMPFLVQSEESVSYSSQNLKFNVPSGVNVVSADMYYLDTLTLSHEELWKYYPLTVTENKIDNLIIPGEAFSFFIKITDSRGYVTSTNLARNLS